jgi:RNA polymerase primary sigma factor
VYAFRVSRRYAVSEDEASTLAAYLREIAKLPRLTVDEERSLGARIQSDRNDARETREAHEAPEDDDAPEANDAHVALTRLVEANLRFVVSYAKRYRGLGVSFLDLIHEGNLGMMEAARRFDPTRNVKFITYAVWWIREAMMHVLAEQTRAFSFPPKLFALLYNGGADVSLSDPIAPEKHDGRSRDLADVLAQDAVPAIEDEMIHQADLNELAAALLDLDRKEREVVCLRFGLQDDEPRTLQEIGDRLHLSRERIRQIESRAKEKLRRSAKLRSRLN